MKISQIKSYSFWVGFRNVCLVKVETDGGLYGWGEAGLSGREQAVMGAVAHFEEFLKGQDPLNISALWQQMYRGAYFEGGRVLAAAIAAIDIALHDIKGKALNVPVYQLLGGKQRDRIPLFATSTVAYDEGFVDDVLRLKDEGWSVIRATTGEHGCPDQNTVFDPRASIAKGAYWLTRAREALGTETVLGVDYHHRLNVAETASFCARMPAGTLDFLEEPIRDESPAAYQNLRQMTDIPFAIGEEFTSKWDFAPYVNSALTNFGRVDICNAGGFTEALKIASQCETAYIDMMPHNPLSPLCTAASIHYCAAISNLAWLELAPYDGDLSDYDRYFINRPEVIDNHFNLSDAPGLGIDVNEDALQGKTFKYWEPPRLVKPDNSYTNW
ncbi:mandelate racemase/muconate lactonizing enzyme family protein [Gilvimarinus agarilyticus]|uniref:mandelate racemase/muconate lactonizing enzyme family protein n=1 Tax=Gilvimarinus sp. 2_MG-2023 TaxID=3062666 RepID=UPI001C094DAD|nr:mandelate racemase/muconate lactonizing enzyme family protein [Gilvimarinus sp. 2_MG-2023]MBU2886401.1 mandelate racemase/muconate lactonizing enzyme family protein [Gilvimarinus agarilyticus]MDO6571080.1 mandelate racemase/muconate lactonizing enzyme family protein [Gilvimarinus sp. 2_MG-2023]